MRKLLLAGGGDAQDSQPLDRVLAQLIAGGSMLYLPIALAPHQQSYASCYRWIRSVFPPSTIPAMTMWTDLSQKRLADVAHFSAIYIGGGNTFKLLHDFKQTGFDHVLLQFLDRGGIVYGGSAGAIVLGKNIMTASFLDPNEVALQDTTGLDLLQGYSVWCHYQREDDLKIMGYIEHYHHPVIALSEQTGLSVDEKAMQVVGFEPVIIFHHQRRVSFAPASPVKLL